MALGTVQLILTKEHPPKCNCQHFWFGAGTCTLYLSESHYPLERVMAGALALTWWHVFRVCIHQQVDRPDLASQCDFSSWSTQSSCTFRPFAVTVVLLCHIFQVPQLQRVFCIAQPHCYPWGASKFALVAMLCPSCSQHPKPGTSGAWHNTKPAGVVIGWESSGWSSWSPGIGWSERV